MSVVLRVKQLLTEPPTTSSPTHPLAQYLRGICFAHTLLFGGGGYGKMGDRGVGDYLGGSFSEQQVLVKGFSLLVCFFWGAWQHQ